MFELCEENGLKSMKMIADEFPIKENESAFDYLMRINQIRADIVKSIDYIDDLRNSRLK